MAMLTIENLSPEHSPAVAFIKLQRQEFINNAAILQLNEMDINAAMPVILEMMKTAHVFTTAILKTYQGITYEVTQPLAFIFMDYVVYHKRETVFKALEANPAAVAIYQEWLSTLQNTVSPTEGESHVQPS